MTGSQAEPGLRIELTLQGIEGIVSESDGNDLTATVAFSGTASSMQVSSLNMCGRTGNLVIESDTLGAAAANQLASTDAEIGDGDTEGLRQHLFATFQDPMEGRRSLSTCNHSTSTSSSSSRPHLELKLPSLKQVPHNILPMTKYLARTRRTGDESPTDDKNASLDIVELHITLRNRDYSICTEGKARIIFDEDGRTLGTKTMDLAIEKNREGGSHPHLGFSHDAYIRVRLDVSTTDNPSLSPSEIRLSEHFDQKAMDGLLVKLKEHEEIADARAKVDKLKFPQEEKGSPRRFFCNGGLDFVDTLRGVVDALTRCDREPTKGRKARGGFMPIIRCNSTMDSTIETRESMMI